MALSFSIEDIVIAGRLDPEGLSVVISSRVSWPLAAMY